MVTLKNKCRQAVADLCAMDVFGSDTLASSTQAKEVDVKPITSTPVTKSRLAALIRIQSRPHAVHNARLKAWDEREYQDDWSDVVSNDPNDQIGDSVEKSPESLEFSFEMVRSADGNGLRIKRQGNPTCPVTKGILLGRSVPNPDSDENFWTHLSQDQIDSFLRMIPDGDTRDRFRAFSLAVPCGILIVWGPPGTGKTWFISMLAVSRTVAGRKIACQSPTNAATTVFYNRYLKILDHVGCRNDFLAPHHYAPHIEVAIILRFLRSQHGKEEWDSDPHYNAFTETSDTDVAKWARDGSAAAAILFILGKIDDFPCGKDILAEMRSLPLILQITDLIEKAVEAHVSGDVPRGDTKPDDFFNGNEDEVAANDGIHDPDIQLQEEHVRSTLKNRSLGGFVKVLLVQIYWRASAIFSTTHVGAGSLVRKFTKTANEYFQDEAGCAAVPESLQLWRMDRRLVLVGDPKQLTSPALSAGARYDIQRGRTHSINPLASQHMRSLMHYGMPNGFPVFVLRVQRRMVRGLFDLSKDIFYNRLGQSSNQMGLSYSETSDTDVAKWAREGVLLRTFSLF